MAKYTVVTMPGDGIGNQVLPESIRVLKAVGFDADTSTPTSAGTAGATKATRFPNAPSSCSRKHKLGLFGAITSKPNKEAEAELKPELRGKGYVYYSPIVTMRQKFNLDICMRPCIGFTGNPLNYIRKRTDGGFDEPQVDTKSSSARAPKACMPESSGQIPPSNVRAALDTHPEVQNLRQRPGRRPRHQRAHHHPRRPPRRICHRRVRVREEMRLQSRHHLRKAQRPARNLRHDGRSRQRSRTRIIPASRSGPPTSTRRLMWLTKNPEDYGVIVASNLFGDVISDAFAGLVGGLGFAASGNIGDEVAVFEPTHGSAPKYAELNPPIVNPIAMILSAAMMLDHVGETDKAEPHSQGHRRRRRRRQSPHLRHDAHLRAARNPSARAPPRPRR